MIILMTNQVLMISHNHRKKNQRPIIRSILLTKLELKILKHNKQTTLNLLNRNLLILIIKYTMNREMSLESWDNSKIIPRALNGRVNRIMTRLLICSHYMSKNRWKRSMDYRRYGSHTMKILMKMKRSMPKQISLWVPIFLIMRMRTCKEMKRLWFWYRVLGLLEQGKIAILIALEYGQDLSVWMRALKREVCCTWSKKQYRINILY